MEAEFERVLGALTKAPLLLKKSRNPSKTEVLDDQEKQLRLLRNAKPLKDRHPTITGFATVSAEVVYQIDKYVEGENVLTIGGEVFIHLRKTSKFELTTKRSHYLSIREARNILMARLDELYSSLDVATRKKYESDYMIMKEEHTVGKARRNVFFIEEDDAGQLFFYASKRAVNDNYDESSSSDYECPYSENSEDSQNPIWY